MEGLKIKAITIEPATAYTILETAVEAGITHGIGYWAKVLDYRRKKIAGVVRTTALKIEDYDGEPVGQGKHGPVYLTRWLHADHIEKALHAILADPTGTDSDGTAQRIIAEEYPDGPLADNIIQVAMFGKVIYG